jgi:hypothetical protein
MDKYELSRRSFLGVTLLGCLSLGGISFLASCKNKPETAKQGAAEMAESSPAAKDLCVDVSGLTEQERQTRVTFKYTGKSPVEGKDCDECRFFAQPPPEGPCGTCEIVKGPINPNGYCTAWVARKT